MSERFITTWRSAAKPLDWDYYVSEDRPEVERVVKNILKQGIKQYNTFRLGDQVTELSSEY